MAEKRTFYVLKVKGKAKIPDYIQVRDEHFTLIGYFRPGRNTKSGRMKDPNQELFRQLEELTTELDYGKIEKVELPAAGA